MNNLYHKDIYNFENPVNSYWESTIDTKNKYKTLNRDISCKCSGNRWWIYWFVMCIVISAKKYNEDVVLLEAGHIGWGSSGRNAGFCCFPPSKLSV